MIGDVAPPELQLALDADDECLARERERIWYVACTRARELLIVPQQSAAAQNSWARVVDLAWAELPALDLSKLDPVGFSPPAEAPNSKSPDGGDICGGRRCDRRRCDADHMADPE